MTLGHNFFFGIQKSIFVKFLQVNPGGLAEHHGVKAGDAVLRINNTPSEQLSHGQAKQEIVVSGNQVTLLVQR